MTESLADDRYFKSGLRKRRSPINRLKRRNSLLRNPSVSAQLKEQEQFLRSIYDAVEYCICVVDVLEDGSFHYVGWNKAAERLTGIPSEDIRGKNPEELFGPVRGAIVRQNYQGCLSAETSISYEEFFPFNGQDIWWITKLNPLKDANGEIYRIVITAIEISDRKAAEE